MKEEAVIIVATLEFHSPTGIGCTIAVIAAAAAAYFCHFRHRREENKGTSFRGRSDGLGDDVTDSLLRGSSARLRIDRSVGEMGGGGE